MRIGVQTEFRIFRQHQIVVVMLAILAAGAAVFLKSGLLLSLCAGVALVFWENQPVKPWRLLGIVYLVQLTLMVDQGILSFPMMPQAQVLYDASPRISIWVFSSHPHAIRLLISYPGVVLSNCLSVPLEAGCSYYTVFCFFCCYMFMGGTVTNLRSHRRQNSVPIIALLLPMNILPLIMNGRLVFSFCGLSVALYTASRLVNERKFRIKHILCFGVGIVLCMTSTGTMMVCLLATTFFVLRGYGAEFFRNKKVLLITGIFVAATIPYVIQMIEKLFRFWGPGLSGILGILQHGIGSKFAKIPFIYLAALLGAVAVAVPVGLFLVRGLLSKRISRMRYYALLVYATVSVCSLPVGLSAGLTVLVPGMIYVSCVIDSLWVGGELKLKA